MSPTAPASGLPAGLQEQARALCRTMSAIHRRGWCEGTGGNFSVVIRRPPELQLLMAPSGVDKGAVKPSALIVVDEDGRVVQGEGKVSAEMELHRSIVQCTGAGAVLHTHSQAATLLSLQAIQAGRTTAIAGDPCPGSGHTQDVTGPAGSGVANPDNGVAQLVIEGLEMLKGLEGIQTHESRIQIPVLGNDQNLTRLSDRARPHLPEAPHGILIAGHGLYAWGVDLRQASRHLEILEFLLEQHWRQRLWNALVNRTL